MSSYWNTNAEKSGKRRWALIAAWGVPALVLLGFLVYLTGAQFVHWVFGTAAGFVPYLLGMIAIAGIAFLLYRIYTAENTYWDETKNTKSRAHFLFVPGIVSLVVLSLAMVAGFFLQGYFSLKSYTGAVSTSQNRVVSYDQRAPRDVAAATAARNLQNTTGEAQLTKSLVSQGKNGLWNTLVVRRGLFQGYETLQSVNVPLYGVVASNDVSFCQFKKSASLRLGGFVPSNNIKRAIDWKTPWNVFFDSSDAYGYCDGNTPIVVVPLVQNAGNIFVPRQVPYGVAVYNGKTGKLSILTAAEKIAKVQGATYPQHLAALQRSATHASGSYGDFFFGRAGYNTTAGDKGDPNKTNRSEILLNRVDGKRTDYTTPLTPQGHSSSIVALSAVNTKLLTPGKLNSLNVDHWTNKYVRSANSTVENNIKSQYSAMADWANGMTVFEIVPAKNGNWVASIGKEQSVIYRATITPDNKITLQDRYGNTVSDNGTVLGANDTNAGSDETGSSSSVSDGDLSKLSTAQLQQLGQQVLDELAARAK